MEDINVDYEWGDLREVIVGLPVMRYPDVGRAAWMAKALEVLPESEASKARERSGKHSKHDLDKYARMEAECEELIEILEGLDVTVHRPSELTDDLVAANYGSEWLPNGYIQAYSRDPIFVVGDFVIELAPGAPNRRAEILGFRKLLGERLAGSAARWVQMPAVDAAAMASADYSKDDAIVLEGGDLLVLGKTVLAGTSENPKVGSSARGVEWLRSLLGPEGYTVERVPLREDFLHLDVALSLPRQGLAIACREAMVDGLPEAIVDWDLIEVSAEQARFLACNGLPVDRDNYILGYNEDEDGSTVQEGLEARGIEVHRLAYGHHTEDGGSIRCSTHPLLRRPAG